MSKPGSWIWATLFSLILFGCEAPKSSTVPTNSLGFPGLEGGIISAHRGGSYPGYPENSLEAFDHVADQGVAIIECDIQITGDNQLVLLHDEDLDRTTTGKGKIRNFDLAAIRQLYLKDPMGEITNYRVPTLRETLLWSKGKSILTLDVKRTVPFVLVTDLVRELDAQDRVVIITYNFEDATKVHRLDSSLMISVSIQSLPDIRRLRNSEIPPSRVLAFTGVARRPDLYTELDKMGIMSILGTIGNLDRSAQVRGDDLYLEFIKLGADILATDRPIEAQRALQAGAL